MNSISLNTVYNHAQFFKLGYRNFDIYNYYSTIITDSKINVMPLQKNTIYGIIDNKILGGINDMKLERIIRIYGIPDCVCLRTQYRITGLPEYYNNIRRIK